ncbi:MAG TPA: tetratricopeptide repeat protein [Rhizomicrobium sp.]|nr:tetratricopeptide repeat protein [Rhizomicrobium sp.]
MRISNAAVIACCLIAASAGAAGAVPEAPGQSTLAPDAIVNIERALDEQRYVDAGRMLDQALMAGARDRRLVLLVGELSLARARYEDALSSFRRIDADPNLRARALQGEGIALSLLGRSDEALAALKEAVDLNPAQWRAWNALGGEYDRRRDWTNANHAYEQALAHSSSAAIVLNNRGFSRMLQGQLDAAAADFVSALQQRPDLAPARTNLRLALAMKGDYDRATSGGEQGARAALLNNAGVAAMLRGDYSQAQNLFGQAMKAKDDYYARAAANLELAHSLMAENRAP